MLIETLAYYTKKALAALVHDERSAGWPDSLRHQMGEMKATHNAKYSQTTERRVRCKARNNNAVTAGSKRDSPLEGI